MGIRQSAPIKTNNTITFPTDKPLDKKICLNDFRFIKQLENPQTYQYVANWMVEQETTKEIMILKEISKIDLYNDRKVEEQMTHLHLLVTLNHTFLLKPKYAFQDLYNLYLIVEFIQGGDLSQNMKTHTFTEAESSSILQILNYQLGFIISAILLKLIFTALKPESILLDDKGYPKLHGLSNVKKIEDYEMGPPEEVLSIYLAPEVLLREQNGPEADFYSLGMILFEMMTGRVQQLNIYKSQQKALEQEISREILIENVIEKQIQVKKSELPEGWSLDAADFINKLIQNNPINRLGYYGIYELKKHNWLESAQWSKIEDRLFPAPYVPRIGKIQRNAKLIQSDIRNKREIQDIKILWNSQDFQNLFAEFHYKWDQEINEIEFNQKQ